MAHWNFTVAELETLIQRASWSSEEDKYLSFEYNKVRISLEGLKKALERKQQFDQEYPA